MSGTQTVLLVKWAEFTAVIHKGYSIHAVQCIREFFTGGNELLFSFAVNKGLV